MTVRGYDYRVGLLARVLLNAAVVFQSSKGVSKQQRTGHMVP